MSKDNPTVMFVQLYSRTGGHAKLILRLAPALENLGMQVVIIGPMSKGGFLASAQARGFRTYRLPLFRVRDPRTSGAFLGNVKWFFAFPLSVGALSYAVLRYNVDIIQAHGFLCLQPAFAKMITRRRLVWYLGGAGYPVWLIPLMMPFISRVATHITVMGDALRRLYRIKPSWRNKVTVLGSIVDPAEFDPQRVEEKAKQLLRAQLSIRENQPVAGCVANISRGKGYEYLLKSIALVAQKIPDVKLLIIGEPLSTQKAYYKELLKLKSSLNLDDKVVFLGLRDDVPALLSLCDVFVFPSLAEGMSLAVPEAMCMCLPVVTTNAGALAEAVVHGKTGLVVPVADPQSMASALVHLFTNPSERAHMGAKGRERAVRLYSVSTYARTCYELYQSLV